MYAICNILYINYDIIPDSAELKSTNERKAEMFSENPTLHCYILFHPAGEILKHEKNSETLCDCVAFQRFAIYELCGIRYQVFFMLTVSTVDFY